MGIGKVRLLIYIPLLAFDSSRIPLKEKGGKGGKVKRGFPKGPKKMVCSPSSLLFAPTLRVLIEIEGESFQCGVGHT